MKLLIQKNAVHRQTGSDKFLALISLNINLIICLIDRSWTNKDRHIAGSFNLKKWWPS